MKSIWNAKLFRDVINEAKKNESRLGANNVKTKREIHEYLAEELHVSTHAIEKWKCPNSNGPSEPEIVKQLEGIFGVSLTLEVCNPLQEKEDDIIRLNSNYSDFVKENIFACYKLMMEYLHSDYIESEDTYCSMRNEIDIRSLAIPKDIYSKIEYIADKLLQPIIYDKNFFETLHTPDIGYFNNEGIFQIDSDESLIKFMAKFFEIIIRIEKELDEFFMKEFHTILIN